jgi:hypothetical protein
MQTEELEKVHKLINSSSLLTPDEKKEWSRLLQEMSGKQVLELIKILSEHEPAKQAEQDVRNLSAAVKKESTMPSWHMPVDLQQKELTTSIPAYELELPPPHPQAEPKPVPVPDPADVQKKVEKIMQEMRKAKEPAAAVKPGVSPDALESLLKAKDAEHLLSSSMRQIPQPAPAAPQPQFKTEPLVLKQLEDLAELTPNVLHGANPRKVYEEILKHAASFMHKSSAYAVISKLEESRLYKTYVSMGIKLLNDTSADRDLAYKKIIDEAMHTGVDFMTKEEFELFLDFRKELDKF